MKKVAFFSKNLEIGGMEKSLIILINELSKIYKVYLYLEEKTGPLLNLVNDNITIKEYKISKNTNAFFRKSYNYLKRLFWKIFKKNYFDFSCCYATYSLPCSRLALIASKNNSLYVHSDYYNFYEKDIEKIKCFFNSINVSKFKNVIFVSNESRDNFCKIYNNVNTKVINNLIDYKNIIKLSKKIVNFKFSTTKINILYVGRLDNSSKNFDLLLDSFRIANNPNLNLFFVGSGTYKNNIEKFIKKYNLNNQIKLLGETINPYPYIKNSDYLILTSKYEGFPVIYNEALVLNKSFITTIPVTDNEIDVKDFFKIVKDKKELIDLLKNLNKQNNDYKVDFERINNNRINKLIELIEEK